MSDHEQEELGENGVNDETVEKEEHEVEATEEGEGEANNEPEAEADAEEHEEEEKEKEVEEEPKKPQKTPQKTPQKKPSHVRPGSAQRTPGTRTPSRTPTKSPNGMSPGKEFSPQISSHAAAIHRTGNVFDSLYNDAINRREKRKQQKEQGKILSSHLFLFIVENFYLFYLYSFYN